MLKAQGRATGGVAPFGFQFIDGRREWHQGEQETHAAIIEHRAAGLSWAKVADKLNATGHPHPHRRPVAAPGPPVHVQGVISKAPRVPFNAGYLRDQSAISSASLASW